MQSLKDSLTDLKNWFFNIPLGFKLYAALNVTMMALLEIFPTWGYHLSNGTKEVVEQYQYWRMATSFLYNGPANPIDIAYLLFCMWVLKITMAKLEQKLSTVYILIELIKQIFVVNLLVNIIVYPLIRLDLLDGRLMGTFGITLPTINFLIQSAWLQPEAEFQVCWLTCFLRKKYLPIFIILAILAAGGMNYWILLFVLLIDVYQYTCKKRPFLALPYSFYQAINDRLPLSFKTMKGFSDLQHSHTALSDYCQDWFQPSSPQTQQPQDRGHLKQTKQQKFQHHWINKEAQFQAQLQEQLKNNPNKEEPAPVPQKQLNPAEYNQPEPQPQMLKQKVIEQSEEFQQDIKNYDHPAMNPIEVATEEIMHYEQLEEEKEQQQPHEESPNKIKQNKPVSKNALPIDDQQQWT